MFHAKHLSFSILFVATAPLCHADPNQQRIKEYTSYAMQHSGSVEAGKKIFHENKKSACANCHQVTGMEKSGPNLDGIGEKYSRAELITHVLQPNEVIKPGYEQAVLLMADGHILTGRFERRTELMVRLLDPTGKQHNLQMSDIDEIRSSDVSLMPSELETTLTVQEFTDLITYLQSLRFGVKTAQTTGGKQVDIHRLNPEVEFIPIHPKTIEFENPVWCGAIPGVPGQVAVVEHQQAKIWRLIRDAKRPRKELFADLRSEVHIGNNQGLMCLAFHPRFQENGRYFLEYEVREEDVVKTTIVERRADAQRLHDSGQASIRYLEVEQPAGNHNGGCIAFGNDGMLYAAFGDGGPQRDPEGYAQNLSEFLGSFIRIDVDQPANGKPYSVPDDNPFLARHRNDPSVHPEIWAIGFREPWRFSFDSLTGDLWVGDVGQSTFEEVSIVKRGENHGWNVREGFVPFSDQYRREGEDYTDPLLAYEHGLGFSVTGGHVYRADKSSSFYGVYIFGDYNTRRVWGLRQSGGRLLDIREIGTAPGGIASFGVDDRGELLLVTYAGKIYQLNLTDAEYE